jgi:hypothetical protein
LQVSDLLIAGGVDLSTPASFRSTDIEERARLVSIFITQILGSSMFRFQMESERFDQFPVVKQGTPRPRRPGGIVNKLAGHGRCSEINDLERSIEIRTEPGADATVLASNRT